MTQAKHKKSNSCSPEKSNSCSPLSSLPPTLMQICLRSAPEVCCCCLTLPRHCRMQLKNDRPTERSRQARPLSWLSPFPEELRGAPDCSRLTPAEDEFIGQQTSLQAPRHSPPLPQPSLRLQLPMGRGPETFSARTDDNTSEPAQRGE